MRWRSGPVCRARNTKLHLPGLVSSFPPRFLGGCRIGWDKPTMKMAKNFVTITFLQMEL